MTQPPPPTLTAREKRIQQQVVPFASDESMKRNNTSYKTCRCKNRDQLSGGSYYCPYELGQMVCKHIYRFRAEFHAMLRQESQRQVDEYNANQAKKAKEAQEAEKKRQDQSDLAACHVTLPNGGFEIDLAKLSERRQAKRCEARSTVRHDVAEVVPADSPLGRLQAAEVQVAEAEARLAAADVANQETAAVDLLDAQQERDQAAAHLEVTAALDEIEQGADVAFTPAERKGLAQYVARKPTRPVDPLWETALGVTLASQSGVDPLGPPSGPEPPGQKPVDRDMLARLFADIRPQLDHGAPASRLKLCAA